ncbi:MAG: phosphoglycerate mutase, partial [Thermodesulfobacteriota bacterium]
DGRVVGRVLDGIKKFGDYKILVMSDHPTPIDIRTHINEPVPFAIYNSADESVKNEEFVYTERSASTSDIFVPEGYKLVSMLIDD